MVVIDEKKFNFRPYVYTLRGIMSQNLYWATNEEVKLCQRAQCLNRRITLFAIVIPSLLPLMLESAKRLAIINS